MKDRRERRERETLVEIEHFERRKIICGKERERREVGIKKGECKNFERRERERREERERGERGTVTKRKTF